MGYKRTTLLLTWPEESEFHDLEVRMRRLSVGRMVYVQGVADRLSEGRRGDVAATLAEVGEVIGEGLISWNLEVERALEDGTTVDEPVPADVEHVVEQDFAMVVELLLAWIEAAVSVPLGSRKRSAPGDGSGSGTSLPPPPEESWASLLVESQENIAAPA